MHCSGGQRPLHLSDCQEIAWSDLRRTGWALGPRSMGPKCPSVRTATWTTCLLTVAWESDTQTQSRSSTFSRTTTHAREFPLRRASSACGASVLAAPVRLSERTVLGSDRGPGGRVAARGRASHPDTREIDLGEGFAVLTDLGSPEGEGTLVNAEAGSGTRPRLARRLHQDRTTRLVFDGASLVPAAQYNKLVCSNLVRKVRDLKPGSRKRSWTMSP